MSEYGMIDANRNTHQNEFVIDHLLLLELTTRKMKYLFNILMKFLLEY